MIGKYHIYLSGIDLGSNWKDIIKPSLMLLWLVVDIFKVWQTIELQCRRRANRQAPRWSGGCIYQWRSAGNLLPWDGGLHHLSRSDHHCHEEPLHQALLHWQQAYCLQKIGTGRFSNVYSIGGNNITAGQKDYAARMMQIEKQREEYYKQLGTPRGVPTMKGATADPDNTGIGYNSIITDLGD